MRSFGIFSLVIIVQGLDFRIDFRSRVFICYDFRLALLPLLPLLRLCLLRFCLLRFGLLRFCLRFCLLFRIIGKLGVLKRKLLGSVCDRRVNILFSGGNTFARIDRSLFLGV